MSAQYIRIKNKYDILDEEQGAILKELVSDSLSFHIILCILKYIDLHIKQVH